MDGSTTMAQSSGRPRVLIVDDDIYTCEMYSVDLRSAGYIVDIANNGVDGLSMLLSGHYDVALLDIILPRMSGSEILNHWRSITPKGRGTPVIIMTNYEQSENDRMELADKADGYLIKAAVTPRDLRRIIVRITHS